MRTPATFAAVLAAVPALMATVFVLSGAPGSPQHHRAVAAGADPSGMYSIFIDGGGGTKLVCDHPPVDDSPPGFVEPPECDGRADGTSVMDAASSIHCVARIEVTGPDPAGNISSVARCYTEWAALASPTGSVVPTWSDGDAGAPPPPPYTPDQVSPGDGDWDSAGDPTIAVIRNCFIGTGAGLFAPSALWQATWSTKTGAGSVDIWASQSTTSCEALEPRGDPILQDLPITFTTQPLSADKDGDGCTDDDELQILANTDSDAALENPAANCGDDPYNPNDGPSKIGAGGTYDFSIVAGNADFDTTEDTPTGTGQGFITSPNTSNECYDGLDNDGDTQIDTDDIQDCNIVPGALFHCKADIEEDPDDLLTVRPICYPDYPTLDINPAAAGDQTGDGLNGAPPPGPVACVSSCYLPLDADPPVLTGMIGSGPEVGAHCGNDLDEDRDGAVNDGCPTAGAFPESGIAGACADAVDAPDEDPGAPVVEDDTVPNDGCPTVVGLENLTFAGCFEAGTPPSVLGNVYLTAVADVLTGVGQVDIFAFQTLTDCQAGTPYPAVLPSISDAPLRIVRQASRAAGWDSDRDGCSDQEELGPERGLGGLRDPYNRWDFFDVPTPMKNGAVAGTDFFAVLGRFGSTDALPSNGIDRNSDPNDTPAPSGAAYHPAFDRAAAVQGGLGHQLTQPNGAIAGSDFFALLGQFGDACTAAPNPPKSP